VRWACCDIAVTGITVFLVTDCVVAYPCRVTSESERGWAEEAGERIEQAFGLCSFASQLAGKAGQ
jgi:hypothetical protein